jgi:hypothetical protein
MAVWHGRCQRQVVMLWILFVTSLVLWAFGVVSSHTLGGRIHVLLAVAIVVIVIRIIQGHRDLPHNGAPDHGAHR